MVRNDARCFIFLWWRLECDNVNRGSTSHLGSYQVKVRPWDRVVVSKKCDGKVSIDIQWADSIKIKVYESICLSKYS